MRWVNFIICSVSLFDVYNELLFLIILNSLFIDSLHFPSVFTYGFIQLLFDVMNQIKIINQVLWLGLICVNVVVRVIGLRNSQLLEIKHRLWKLIFVRTSADLFLLGN